MNRAKPYKIIIVLAIVVVGLICMLLPEKKVVPTASIKGAVENVVGDTIDEESNDIFINND